MLKYIVSSVHFLLIFRFTICDNCKSGSYDFSLLKGYTWKIGDGTGSTRTVYDISFCQPLDHDSTRRGCQKDTTVCKYSHDANSMGVPLGNHTNELNVTVDTSKSEVSVTWKGAPCPDGNYSGDFLKTVIIFKCGKTLGSPTFLNSASCDTYFEWYSTLACKSPPSDQHQVKCYVYDGHSGRKKDLDHLIRQKGGHRVESDRTDTEFFINVCRDIVADGQTTSCPAGSAACMMRNGHATDFGHPNVLSPLSSGQDHNLVLTYESDSISTNCIAKPRTTITFVCPKRGGNKAPRLTSTADCRYEVEWETEHACAEDYLISKTCKLTAETHGVDFDLSPLQKLNGLPYDIKIFGQSENDTYLLDICDKHQVACPDDTLTTDKVSVCQWVYRSGSATKQFVLGQWGNHLLRYADGKLTLEYMGGDVCHHSHFHRMTVIEFQCHQDGGVGKPEFDREDDCTYFFRWNTSYACLAERQDLDCSVDDSKRHFDLSILMRESKEDNWLALEDPDSEAERDKYFINVCKDVLKKGEAQQCPEGAACLKTADGSLSSLGKFVSSPTYDDKTGSVRLHYTGGGTCDGTKTIETIITFKCKPGDRESGPVLIRKSRDSCVYEFDWQTAGACVQTRKTGSDCKVEDVEQDVSFDLSSLTKENSYYKVTSNTTQYDYYINVCAGVTGTHCNPSAGSCQVKKQSNTTFNTGKANGKLSYYDGILKLIYRDGDNYKTSPPVSRQTEITFLCDPKDKTGQPRFIEETNHTYVFQWFTSYACSERNEPVECVALDEKTGQEYDLSKWTKKENEANWISFDDSLPNRKKKFYLNLCKPLTSQGLGDGIHCDSQAAACVTEFQDNKEVLSISNIGETVERPRVRDDGHIIVEYKNGDNCTDGSRQSNYRTMIDISCKRGIVDKGPEFVEKTGNCLFLFRWETEAGCNLKDVFHDNCTVTDPTSGFTFNLQPLNKTGDNGFYTATDETSSTEYKLNVCGRVPGCGSNSAGVCKADKFLTGFNTKLEYSGVGWLSLKYIGSLDTSGVTGKALITFECDRKIPLGSERAQYVAKDDDNTYQFRIKTAVACVPEPISCVTSDKAGNEYDLTGLAQTKSNWEVMDTRPGHPDLKYYISVCQPLKPIPGSSCTGGNAGACQVTSQGNQSFVLGYIQGQPEVISEGQLRLRYLNGDMCHKGTSSQSYRSTLIHFVCADAEGSPVFNEESAECEYSIEWRTPAACPIKRVMGEDCRVEEPLYHSVFDLSGLTNHGNYDWNVTVGQYTFVLNICERLRTGNGTCKGAGACQLKSTDPNFTRNTGNANGKLEYRDGELQLKYTGGQACHSNQFNRSTVIRFICDPTTYGKNGPNYLNESSSCSYLFEWPTSLACSHFEHTVCTVRGPGGEEYDLSSLTRTRDNYQVDYQGVKYLINVCTNLVFKKGMLCPPSAAACMISPNETDHTKKYSSIGKVDSASLVVEKDHLILTYSDGSKQDGSHSTTTKISLSCDRTAIDTEPEFVMHDGSEYIFSWKTRAACPVNEQPSLGNCTVENPATGKIFDLESLKSSDVRGYKVLDDRGFVYRFDICRPLQTSSCSKSSGCCQEESGQKRHTNAGNANADLVYKDGIITLDYQNGERCHHVNSTRNTIISLMCGKTGDGRGEPVFVGETDNCTYYISWVTDLVCDEEVECSVEKDNHEFDLSPLIKVTGHHTASMDSVDPEINNATFYISVCRPLNPIQNSVCPPDAAICQVQHGKTSLSLGRAVNKPFLDPETGKVTITYDHGTSCDREGSKRAKSKIVFSCREGNTVSAPSLIEYNRENCEYVFDWETNLVCEEKKYVGSCSFTDSVKGQTYNFSMLTSSSDTMPGYQVDSKYGKYFVNVCGPLKDMNYQLKSCKGAAVCMVYTNQTTAPFAFPGQNNFVVENDNIKMVYPDGSTCGTGKRKAYILFSCSRTVSGLGRPSLSYELPCSVLFNWKTPIVCPPVQEECVFALNGVTYDLATLSRQGTSWQVAPENTDDKYWLNICEGVGDGPSGCPPDAAVCRQTSGGQVDVLGSVQTQTTTYQKDKGGILLTYATQHSACAQESREGAKTISQIYMTCGKAIGSPVFKSKRTDDSQCIFQFEWQTRAACRDKRTHVKDENGFIADPRTDKLIDLAFLKKEKELDTLSYHYIIDIYGEHKQSGCSSGICRQKKASGTNVAMETIGGPSKKMFFVTADSLEVELPTDTQCSLDPQRKVTSIILVRCRSEESLSLDSDFNDCEYVFLWHSPQVCANAEVEKPGNGGGSVSGASSNNIVVIVVSVLVSVAVVVVLVVVFYKKERRIACSSGVRNFLQNRFHKTYTRLSGSDEVNSLLTDDLEDGYGTDTEDSTPRPPLFSHHDSDDELII